MVRYLILSVTLVFMTSGLRAAGLECGSVYKVKAGDSLGRIASRAYGSSRLYSVIYSANSAALKNGTSSVRVGQKLKIPCVQGETGSGVDVQQAVAPVNTPSPGKALFLAARDAQIKQVVSLVQQGADVNYRNLSRETPMHAAASVGRVDILHYLHGRGARYIAPTTNRWLPLHHAVRFGHVQAAQYLIRLGSPLNASTRDNKTVFDMAYATRNGAMVRMLNQYRR